MGYVAEEYKYTSASGLVSENKELVPGDHPVVSGQYASPLTLFSEIRISYDLSPLSVTNSRRRPSFLHFLVQVQELKFNCTSNRKLRFSLRSPQLCAIIGGIFTVFGLLDASM